MNPGAPVFSCSSLAGLAFLYQNDTFADIRISLELEMNIYFILLFQLSNQ